MLLCFPCHIIPSNALLVQNADTAPIQRPDTPNGKANGVSNGDLDTAEDGQDIEKKGNESSKDTPQPIIDMLTSKLTRENVLSLGFIDYDEIKKHLDEYLSGEWTSVGYGGLPRCLRICLLVYSLLILKQRFGVRTWQPDVYA